MATPRQVRYSRWRRLPGLHRITEQKIPDHRAELQRLTLYVPGSVLDTAELLAARAGAGTVQAYCEALLRGAVASEADRDRQAHDQSTRLPFVSLGDLENDPDYLAEWTASASQHHRAAAAALEGPTVPEDHQDPDLSDVLMITDETPSPSPRAPSPSTPPADPVEVVLRHAGLGADSSAGFLAAFRRGEPIAPESAEELLRALLDLERRLDGETAIDRRLAYALHRLAFEGQILLTDAWPNVAADQATVDVLRMVQEAVDRVISGEDIRYYQREPEPGSSP